MNPNATKQITLLGPFPADPAAVERMEEQGRMREVTLAPLREVGFRSFGWASDFKQLHNTELGPIGRPGG